MQRSLQNLSSYSVLDKDEYTHNVAKQILFTTFCLEICHNQTLFATIKFISNHNKADWICRDEIPSFNGERCRT